MTTSNLQLPEVPQAILTAADELNAGLLTTDAVVQLGVISRIVTAPPANAVQGDRYIVPAGATGLWVNRTNHVAYLGPTGWLLFVPRPGWLAWSRADTKLYIFDLGTWTEFTSGGGADLTALTFLTAGDETADAPNSLMLVPGTNIGFDDSVPGVRTINATSAGRGRFVFTFAAASGNLTPPLPSGFAPTRIEQDCTITRVTLLTFGGTGSCVVDLYSKAYASYPPTGADSICASTKPSISSGIKYQDSALTSWTVNLVAGDVLAANLDSSSTFKKVVLIVEYEVTP